MHGTEFGVWSLESGIGSWTSWTSCLVAFDLSSWKLVSQHCKHDCYFRVAGNMYIWYTCASIQIVVKAHGLEPTWATGHCCAHTHTHTHAHTHTHTHNI